MSGLQTDHYELTMLRTFVADGIADTPATFEVFARHLPPGRTFGMLAGTGRFIDALADLRFEDAQIAWLLERGIIDDATAARLADFSFSGSISGYREGDVYLPHSPVMTVDTTLGEGVLLETLALSILNHDTAIASAAARMRLAARDAGLIEMGSRRTHEDSAVAAARAAYLAGFTSSSNLEAGFVHGVPTAGTVAHAFVLAYPNEAEAFASQITVLGADTTLLVDTHDTEQGIRTAIKVGGPSLGAIRIDSGDLGDEARRARTMLDEAGCHATRIIATGDLNEFRIAELVAAGAPIDGYGVGTELVSGGSHLTPGFVYKLVAVADDVGTMRPVAKQSVDKSSTGGRKQVRRGLRDGRLVVERLALDDAEVAAIVEVLRADGLEVADPTIDYVVGGQIHDVPSLAEARGLAASTLTRTLPDDAADR